eukprot:g13526.t1
MADVALIEAAQKGDLKAAKRLLEVLDGRARGSLSVALSCAAQRNHLEMAKLLLDWGARADGDCSCALARVAKSNYLEIMTGPAGKWAHGKPPGRTGVHRIDAECLDINAEIHIRGLTGDEVLRVLSTFRDSFDAVIELMGEGARCENLAPRGSSALQHFSRDRQNVHTSLTNKALCRNVQAAYKILDGISIGFSTLEESQSQTLLELETELKNKNIPDSFWQQAQEANKSSCSGRGRGLAEASMQTDIAGWKKMLQKTVSTAGHHALVAEAQARLLKIRDRAKLQEVYDRIIDGDHATYWVNKLRGLLFQALSKEFGDELAKRRAEGEHDDTRLWGLMQDLGDVAEIFTRVCMEHTVEVVDPVSV